MEDETYTPPEPTLYSPGQYQRIYFRYRDRIKQYIKTANTTVEFLDERTPSGGTSRLIFEHQLYRAINHLVDGMAEAARDLQNNTERQIKALDYHGCITDTLLEELHEKETSR